MGRIVFSREFKLEAVKLQSCLTLFSLATPNSTLIDGALLAFFGGERDQATLAQLRA